MYTQSVHSSAIQIEALGYSQRRATNVLVVNEVSLDLSFEETKAADQKSSKTSPTSIFFSKTCGWVEAF